MTPDAPAPTASTRSSVSPASRFAPILALAAWYLGVSMLTRVVLWAVFGSAAGVGAGSLIWILPAGLLSDALQALYLLAPLTLLLTLLPDRCHGARSMRVLLLGGSFVWMFGLLFIAASEYFFFEEFDARFNLVSVNYLVYPTEVAGDIWSEYPVIAIVITALLTSLASTWALRGWLLRGPGSMTTLPGRARVGLAMLALLALGGLTFSTNSLGLSTNRVANELAANGPSSFFRALRTSEIDYHAYYASRIPADNLALLARELGKSGGRFTRLAEGRLDREFEARPDGLGKLNVVLISSESFGAEFSRLYGAEHDWTPQFDQLAKAGLWFRHTYSSGTRTVRGLEALTASLPPIPTESILRRPGNENLATLGKVLRGHGYHTSFLYGGYGYFDNMNAFFEANGYEVLDRNQLKRKPRFENIWGVADEDLFDMALEHADGLTQQHKPFFLHIMTTSNHKPFTFRRGLEDRGILPAGGGRESGVRYADYAQGYLLREARKHAWFDDTIFIIVADHGARVYGKQDIPLKTYEIPLLFYSPKHLPARRVDGLMTQIDVAPTLMGLLGLPYTAPWFGRDALNSPEASRIALFSHNHDVALLRDGRLSMLGLQKAISQVRYDAKQDRYATVSAQDAQLNELTIAYYQTAFELFRNRKYD